MQISRNKFTLILVLIALTLAGLGVGFSAYEWSLGVNNTYWAHELAEIFALNQEANIPSFFSAALLLMAAMFALVIAYQSKPNTQFLRRAWWATSLLFLYLSIDEASSIHEMFTTPMREAFGLGGYFYFGWILVGIPIAIVVGLLFLPFVLKLPSNTRNFFFLAAFVYLFGAIVVEAYSAPLYEEAGYATFFYDLVSTVEEFLEMLGVIILIYALLDYLAKFGNSIEIKFSEK